MSQGLSPVQFIDTPVPCPENYSCFCLNDESKDIFIAHQTLISTNAQGKQIIYNGKRHPFHKDCIQGWLQINSLCPICHIPIENTLVTPRDKVVHLASYAAANAASGAKEVESPMIFGAATLALIAAVELSGLRGAKDVLAIGGCSYGIAAFLFGLGYGTMGGPETGADHRISETALAGAFGGMLVGIGAWFLGATQESYAAQILGVVAIAKSTGLIPLAFGAGIGATTATVVSKAQWFGGYATKEAVATIAAGIGAVVSHIQLPNNFFISAITTRFGYTVAMIAHAAFPLLEKKEALMLTGIVAGSVAVMSSKLLSRAYNACKKPTFS